jgi:hypothetical protein
MISQDYNYLPAKRKAASIKQGEEGRKNSPPKPSLEVIVEQLAL